MKIVVLFILSVTLVGCDGGKSLSDRLSERDQKKRGEEFVQQELERIVESYRQEKKDFAEAEAKRKRETLQRFEQRRQDVVLLKKLEQEVPRLERKYFDNPTIPNESEYRLAYRKFLRLKWKLYPETRPVGSREPTLKDIERKIDDLQDDIRFDRLQRDLINE